MYLCGMAFWIFEKIFKNGNCHLRNLIEETVTIFLNEDNV